MKDKICVIVDYLYYDFNDDLVFLRDLIFRNFPVGYNFTDDIISFAYQELKDKGIPFNIDSLSFEISFCNVDGLREFLSDLPCEVLNKTIHLLDYYER